MQFCGQFGIVQAAHGGIEIRWFVNAATVAPFGGRLQPALFPERRALGPASLAGPAPSALAAPSLVVMTAVASLNEASLLAAPPPLPLPDAAPLMRPDADSSPDPALEPVATLPLPIAEPTPDPVVDAPLPAPPAPAPLVPFWAGPGPVWLALQAAATKAAQNNLCRKDVRPTSTSVEVRAPFDHSAELSTARKSPRQPHGYGLLGGSIEGPARKPMITQQL
jgi:hypothetical protein